jgi:hypothetical protein
MKTIWGLLIIVTFSTILFGGISIVNNDILAHNVNINNKSTQLIGKYDSQVSNMTNLQKSKYRVDSTLSSNQTNQVDAFFRQYAENKNNIDKTKTAISFIWNIPAIILLSIPFISINSNTLINLINGVIYLLISILILLSIYKAVRTGKVDDES